jgi:uncharacterized protein
MAKELPKKSKRGFASMSPERRQEIASMGGKSVPPENRTFSKDRERAAKAGRVGGKSVPAERRSFSTNHVLATTAGKNGGVTSRTGKGNVER